MLDKAKSATIQSQQNQYTHSPTIEEHLQSNWDVWNISKDLYPKHRFPSYFVKIYIIANRLQPPNIDQYTIMIDLSDPKNEMKLSYEQIAVESQSTKPKAFEV